MKATNEQSKAILEIMAELLCQSAQQRELLQHIYDLGKTDGAIEILEKRVKND